MAMHGFLIFLGAYATSVAMPGPGVTALVARVLARGTSGIPAYLAGFAVGDLAWFAAAVCGLTAIATTFHPLIVIIRYAGAAYLLFMAYKLITTPPAPPHAAESVRITGRPIRDFGSSLALTLGNPKAIVFFLALLPAVLDLDKLRLTTGVMLGVAMALTQASILGAYALMAARSRRFFRSTKAMKALNVGSGAVMAGAAVAIAAK